MRTRSTGDGPDKAAEQERTEETAAQIRAGLDRPTLGEVIDRLGPRPEGRLHEHAVKAFVITISPVPGIPQLTSVATHAAGALSLPEVLGLLELAKRDLMSEQQQQKGLDRFLSGQY